VYEHQITEPPGRSEYQVCYVCPRQSCAYVFIANYTRSGGTWRLGRTEPRVPKAHAHSAEIREVSPDYVTIWDQAATAEAVDLSEVAGVGYRKALEFLIKDYLITTGVSLETVKGKQLGACIKDHVTQAQVRNCAERAAWLGNDETHYERKWSEFGLAELKELIQITVAWIELEKRTAHFKLQMPAGRR